MKLTPKRSGMGLVTIEVVLERLAASKRSYRSEFLVDTGAIRVDPTNQTLRRLPAIPLK